MKYSLLSPIKKLTYDDVPLGFGEAQPEPQSTEKIVRMARTQESAPLPVG